MTEQQAFNAIHLLAELWADQMGYENPKIFIKTKNHEGEDKVEKVG